MVGNKIREPLNSLMLHACTIRSLRCGTAGAAGDAGLFSAAKAHRDREAKKITWNRNRMLRLLSSGTGMWFRKARDGQASGAGALYIQYTWLRDFFFLRWMDARSSWPHVGRVRDAGCVSTSSDFAGRRPPNERDVSFDPQATTTTAGSSGRKEGPVSTPFTSSGGLQLRSSSFMGEGISSEEFFFFSFCLLKTVQVSFWTINQTSTFFHLIKPRKLPL